MNQSHFLPYGGRVLYGNHPQATLVSGDTSVSSPCQMTSIPWNIANQGMFYEPKGREPLIGRVPVYVALPVSPITSPVYFTYPAQTPMQSVSCCSPEMEMSSPPNDFNSSPNLNQQSNRQPSSLPIPCIPSNGNGVTFNKNYPYPYRKESIRRPYPGNPLYPTLTNSKKAHISDMGAAQILCQLGKHQALYQNSVKTPSMSRISLSTQSKHDSDYLLNGKSCGHVICIYCFKRNTLQTPKPPSILQCYSCGGVFPVVKRFIHDYSGSYEEESSLELPFLHNLTSTSERRRAIDSYLQSVLVGRRCNYSSSLRDIQKVLTSMVSKVDRLVTKEQKHIDEECRGLMDSLVMRVDQYLNGELHCCCFQPAYPQRHFIQCDVCDMWFHTSCVGIDSRKLAATTSFTCPWCLTLPEVQLKKSGMQEMVVEDEQECICPFCKRVFPRPCNLSRHLHAKHNMKWNTHRMLHVDVDDYLEMTIKSMHSYKNISKKELFEGCFVVEEVLQEFGMDISHYRFLLRKLRVKPSQWWVGRDIRVWDPSQQLYRLGTVKCIRPRSDYCISFSDGSSMTIGSLFDPVFKVRLLILNGSFELELYHALPTPRVRDIQKDLHLFI